MGLSIDHQNILNSASRAPINDAMTRLTGSWTNQNWLRTRNRYRLEARKKVRQDARNGDTFVHSHLIEYLAASVLGHCYDGWSYLARALEAEMSGDPDAARHLGYYAELRAAMSLLSSEGIGVFDRHHAVALGSGRCKSLHGPPTHQFTWDALEYWADLPSSANLILKSIRPAGIPLEHWLAAFGGGVTFVASSWLKQWGLDLARLGKDRDARNLASYRPSALTSPGPQSIHETIGAVTNLWHLCSPGSRGEFSTMDRHLLRSAVELLFKASFGRSSRQAIKVFGNRVSSMISNQVLTEGERARIHDFLLYQQDPEVPDLFSSAARNDGPAHINHSRQVLARATLLLRVATGSLANMLDESNVELRTDLAFWWNKPTVRRRMWATHNEPESFKDLWGDVTDSVDAVLEWAHGAPDPSCGKSFWDSHSNDAAVLTTPERIFLWGISP